MSFPYDNNNNIKKKYFLMRLCWQKKKNIYYYSSNNRKRNYSKKKKIDLVNVVVKTYVKSATCLLYHYYLFISISRFISGDKVDVRNRRASRILFLFFFFFTHVSCVVVTFSIHGSLQLFNTNPIMMY